jgi:flagellar protein FlaF
MSSQNPYSKAAGAYATQVTSTDQRTLEGTILLQTAQKLEDLATRLEGGEKVGLEELGATLTHNRKLWELFVNDMGNPDHHLPQDLKNNIASLALFVFKRTQEILIETQPGKFRALININRSIAAGLMKQGAAAAPAPVKPSTETAATDRMA